MSDIKKGLAGVVVDTTSVSKVNPETNSLLYRGYPVRRAGRQVLVRGGRVPALVRRAADRHAAARRSSSSSGRTAPSTSTSSA